MYDSLRREGRPHIPRGGVSTVKIGEAPSAGEEASWKRVFAPEFELNASDGKTIKVKIAQFRPESLEIGAPTTLEVQKEGGEWVRTIFDPKTLKPFVRGPFAAALGAENPSTLKSKMFWAWLVIQKVTMLILDALKQKNFLPFAIFIVVLLTLAVGQTVGLGVAVGQTFAGFSPFVAPEGVFDWFNAMSKLDPNAIALSRAIMFLPTGYALTAGVRQQIDDGVGSSTIWDAFRNLLIPLGSTLAWLFYSVAQMNWIWYAGSTTVLLTGAVHKGLAHNALSDFTNQAFIEARTQQAYLEQSRAFLDTLIRLAHDALHIRFKDGEIYPRTGAWSSWVEDLPRAATNLRYRDYVMWIHPASQHQKLLTAPSHKSTASAADIQKFCTNVIDDILVAELDKRLGDVINSLMRLHLLLRTVVSHGHDDTTGGPVDKSARLCEPMWREAMQKTWEQVRNGTDRFHRAAFLFVWRDFLVCRERHTGQDAERTLASLVESRKEHKTTICANVFNMTIVSGEAFRRVDDRKWLLLQNRYAGRRSDGSRRRCDDKPSLPDMCVDVKPTGREQKRTSDGACVDALLIFLGLLWAENRRLLLRLQTDDALTQTEKRLSISIDTADCNAVCPTPNDTPSMRASEGAFMM
jgi:hypothetical protein